MLSDLRAPRELVLLMRLVAIIGATKIAVVVYAQFINPMPPTAAEVAAAEREIAALAEEGDARVFADFRKRAPSVAEAARECGDSGGAPCRWAEIWLERYGGKVEEVLRAPSDYDTETFAAAQEYRGAMQVMRK